jgi:hypothetical protein
MKLDGVHVRLYYFIVVVKQKPWGFLAREAAKENGCFTGFSEFAQSSLVLETVF